MEKPLPMKRRQPQFPGAEESGAEEKVKVGFIVGTGGLGDQGFNDISYLRIKAGGKRSLEFELEYA